MFVCVRIQCMVVCIYCLAYTHVNAHTRTHTDTHIDKHILLTYSILNINTGSSPRMKMTLNNGGELLAILLRIPTDIVLVIVSRFISVFGINKEI